MVGAFMKPPASRVVIPRRLTGREAGILQCPRGNAPCRRNLFPTDDGPVALCPRRVEFFRSADYDHLSLLRLRDDASRFPDLRCDPPASADRPNLLSGARAPDSDCLPRRRARRYWWDDDD